MNDSDIQELFSLRNEYRSLRYDLGNIRALCEELGDPQRAFQSVLIAGTNGKGSVARFLSAMLPGAGLYVSPHLERLNERISIGGREIDDESLTQVFEKVRRASERAQSRLLYPPTFFERVTAMAFCFFQDRVDHAVLEVGLGGRLDATNVVSQDVSVITSLGLDHQEHLGETLEEIAFEKAGIIKDSEPVVIGPGCDLPAVRERAGERIVDAGALRARVGGVHGEDSPEGERGCFEIQLTTELRRYARLRPRMAGRHQIENLKVAVRAAECLEACGWPLDASSSEARTRRRHPAGWSASPARPSFCSTEATMSRRPRRSADFSMNSIPGGSAWCLARCRKKTLRASSERSARACRS